VPLEVTQGNAATVKCLGIVGLERQRAVIAGERLRLTPEVAQGTAAIAQGLGKVGVDRQRPVVAGERLLVAPEVQQGVADVRMRRSVIWIYLQSLAKKLHRCREILALSLNQP